MSDKNVWNIKKRQRRAASPQETGALLVSMAEGATPIYEVESDTVA